MKFKKPITLIISGNNYNKLKVIKNNYKILKNVIILNNIIYYFFKKKKYKKFLKINYYFPKDIFITNKISTNSTIKYYNKFKNIKKKYKYYDIYYNSILYFKKILKNSKTVILLGQIGNLKYKLFSYGYKKITKYIIKNNIKLYFLYKKKIFIIKK
ncbi:MAG: phosphoglycerate kinase [Candidatus Shikimatogenerans sp. Ttur]|uniref:phosphoglycerate kinase n=1 Tax=Candidatus Shikimatogenerans sp. Ttur TaxID=3158569 RepID=A0AAU7ZY12_9FLAO